ncbi:MAG: FTR1 family iron permease [Candidatus Hodarchaeales archaeon]
MLSEILSIFVTSFISSLREMLEAVLIIGIIISYLQIIDRKDLYRDVLYGVLAAIFVSIGLAWIFLAILEGIGAYQELFEGIIMIIAAGFLTWMVIWMMKQSKTLLSDLHVKISDAITDKQRTGILLLVFFSVSREGAELVLLLYATFIKNYTLIGVPITSLTIIFGLISGLFISALLAILLYKYSYRIETKRFFQITSVLLIIFAAGLLANGLHEIFEFFESTSNPFAEAFIWTEVWNINDTFIGDILQFLFSWMYDPSYPMRFEKSIFGSILVGLFGWNDNPIYLVFRQYFYINSKN